MSEKKKPAFKFPPKKRYRIRAEGGIWYDTEGVNPRSVAESHARFLDEGEADSIVIEVRGDTGKPRYYGIQYVRRTELITTPIVAPEDSH